MLRFRCDECNKAYHFNCLEPPLKKSPKRRGYSWFCEDCDSAVSTINLAHIQWNINAPQYVQIRQAPCCPHFPPSMMPMWISKSFIFFLFVRLKFFLIRFSFEFTCSSDSFAFYILLTNFTLYINQFCKYCKYNHTE